MSDRQKLLIRVLMFVAKIINEDKSIAADLNQLALHIEYTSRERYSK